jgi:hypothetical protein
MQQAGYFQHSKGGTLLPQFKPAWVARICVIWQVPVLYTLLPHMQLEL